MIPRAQLHGLLDALVGCVDIFGAVPSDAHACGAVTGFVFAAFGVGYARRCPANMLRADALIAAVLIAGAARLGLAGGTAAGVAADLAQRAFQVAVAFFSALANQLFGAAAAKLPGDTPVFVIDATARPAHVAARAIKRRGTRVFGVTLKGDALAALRVALLGRARARVELAVAARFAIAGLGVAHLVGRTTIVHAARPGRPALAAGFVADQPLGAVTRARHTRAHEVLARAGFGVADQVAFAPDFGARILVKAPGEREQGEREQQQEEAG